MCLPSETFGETEMGESMAGLRSTAGRHLTPSEGALGIHAADQFECPPDLHLTISRVRGWSCASLIAGGCSAPPAAPGGPHLLGPPVAVPILSSAIPIVSSRLFSRVRRFVPLP